jgi:hypothetical protein
MTALHDDWPEPSDTVAHVLEHLENVTQTDAEQWSARCPAHDDHAPSLAVGIGESQPLTMYCHAGCEYADIVDALVEMGADQSVLDGKAAVLRLRKRGQRTAPLRAVPDPQSEPPVLTEVGDKWLDWHDRLMDRAKRPDSPEAELLSYLTGQRGLTRETVERFKIGYDGDRLTIPVKLRGKLRNVRRYKPGGKPKIYNWKGFGTSLLYPEDVLRVHSGTVPVLFCEGEWDALLANQESGGQYVAVTGTGGARTPPQDLSALAGRRVYIAYDADQPGAKGAGKLSECLSAAGATPHVLDLTALGLTPGSGEDITDYFTRYGGTAERLVAEMERATGQDREPFRTISAAELAGPVPAMRWLVQGVWPEGSYGVLAGEKKTLKTYTSLSLALSVASGEPFLGRFHVPEIRPVLMYLGEGGQNPTARRLQRIASSMGVDLGSVPLRIAFDAGDITGDTFLRAFNRAIAEEQPGLVIVDPLYAFHPVGIEAQNLYDRGQMLAQIQQMVPEGCALIIADHFRKSGGKDLDLDSIAQSGVAQWSDSWILQTHDTPPRVDAGDFSIGVQFGSRQWGGQQYLMDWSLGRFDEESGEHVGALSVAVSSVEWGAKSSGRAHAEDLAVAALIGVLEAAPAQLTRNKTRDRFYDAYGKKSQPAFDRAWSTLTSEGRVLCEPGLVTEGARQVSREVWRMNPEPTPKLTVSAEGADSS